MICGWFFAVFFTLLFVSMVMLGNWLQAIVLLLMILLCLPPVTSFIQEKIDFKIHPLIRIGSVAVLFFIFTRLLLGGELTTIYKTEEAKQKFIEIYNEKMETWPVPYEDLFLDTQYGIVHVIASGNKDAEPMLLLHASGVGGWSWLYNAEGLSELYRIYAIDLIGDAGKSEFRDYKNILKDGKDQAVLYEEIMDLLEVDSAFIVGASEGGFIASNIAHYAPKRVKKLVLLGPMGYSGAIGAVIRITLSQLFPLEFVQKATFRWAFSSSEKIMSDFGEWFILFMNNYIPAKVAPFTIPAEQRQSIKMPVMFVFGKRDNLVGNPEKAKELVQDMDDVHVEIVDAGHLMGAEIPEEINSLIIDFIE